MEEKKYMEKKKSFYIPKNEIFRDYRDNTVDNEINANNIILQCEFDEMEEEEWF